VYRKKGFFHFLYSLSAGRAALASDQTHVGGNRPRQAKASQHRQRGSPAAVTVAQRYSWKYPRAALKTKKPAMIAPRITCQGQTPREQLQPPTIHESGAQNLVDALHSAEPCRALHLDQNSRVGSSFIIREVGRERDLLHKNVRSNSVIHMVCALRVRFGPPALNVANYPEISGRSRCHFVSVQQVPGPFVEFPFP
jgi:hypothetical protein